MRPLLSILVVAMGSLAASAEDRPVDRVLQHVPNDAALVVVVPDMKEMVSGLRAFGDAVGADDLSDLRFRRILLKRFGKRVAGVDERGAFALALPACKFQPVFVGSLSDTDAWDKGMNPADPRGGPFTFRHKKHTWFARRIGTIGIIGRDKQSVAAAVKANGGFADRFKPHARPMLNSDQMLVWADVPAWRPIFVPALAVAEGFLEVGMRMAQPEAEGSMALMKWAVGHARTTVMEAQVYAAGLAFRPDGFFGHDIVTVEPDGKIAGYLKKVQKSDRDLLRGLPNVRGMFVLGAEWSLPKGTETASEAMLRAMLDTKTGRECLKDDEIKAGIDASMQLYRKVQGYNGLVSTTTEGNGLTFSGVYLTDNPRVVMRTLRKSISTLAGTKMMSLWGPDLEVEIERTRTKIGTVASDAYAFTFTSEDEHVKQMLRAMYGDAPVMFVAPHPNGVAYAIGPDSGGREAITQMLAGDTSPLTENEDIVIARNAISAKPDMCLFVDLPGLVEFGLSVAKATGAPVPPMHMTKEPSPYLAFGIYLERESMRGEIYVPANAIKRLMESFDQAPAEEKPIALR